MNFEPTYSQVREQFKSLMDRAVGGCEDVEVQSRLGDAVGMIAADDLERLLESAHLLRSSKNATHFPFHAYPLLRPANRES